LSFFVVCEGVVAVLAADVVFEELLSVLVVLVWFVWSAGMVAPPGGEIRALTRNDDRPSRTVTIIRSELICVLSADAGDCAPNIADTSCAVLKYPVPLFSKMPRP
jgi:hypothetical protein